MVSPEATIALPREEFRVQCIRHPIARHFRSYLLLSSIDCDAILKIVGKDIIESITILVGLRIDVGMAIGELRRKE